MKISGARAIFQSLETYTTASPPNSAGKMLANAGASTGLSNTGRSAPSMHTPRMMITVVTREETAMANVDSTSPSSEPGSTPAERMALSAQGTLRLVKLPVTKPKSQTNRSR